MGEHFMKPLRHKEIPSGSLLTEEQFKIIFCDIEVILKVNEFFLGQLEDSIKCWDPLTTKIGQNLLNVVILNFF
jgi:hypothetical protein